MGSVVHGAITGTSPAAASTAAVGSTLVGVEKYAALQIACEVQGATGGTLDLYIQTSFDGTVFWDLIHLPQLAAAAAAVKYMVNLPNMGATAITVVGKTGTPALAANTVTGGVGSWGRSLRLLAVAGAGTSAGAVQTITVHGYIPIV